MLNGDHGFGVAIPACSHQVGWDDGADRPFTAGLKVGAIIDQPRPPVAKRAEASPPYREWRVNAIHWPSDVPSTSELMP
jgi:hypothetical protein